MVTIEMRNDQHFFVGHRTDGNPFVIVKRPDGSAETLDPRFDCVRHSPDGFEWGYGGSGPAQLAFAMVARATGDRELAGRVYQEFKRQIVQQIPRDEEWKLGLESVARFARSLDQIPAG